MTTYSSILAWEIPLTEEPGRLQSMGSQRVRHNLSTKQQQTMPQYFSNVMSISHLRAGGEEGNRGWDGISRHELEQTPKVVKDREMVQIHGVSKIQAQLSNWTTTKYLEPYLAHNRCLINICSVIVITLTFCLCCGCSFCLLSTSHPTPSGYSASSLASTIRPAIMSMWQRFGQSESLLGLFPPAETSDKRSSFPFWS